MHKKFIQIAAVLGAVTVILGAFGAHALKQVLPTSALATFETAVRYQFYHVFAILLTGILYKEYMNTFVQRAGHLFIIGIVLFSGSLYLLTYLEATETIGYRGIGAITPIGGLCFISGWVLLAIGVKSK
ncbi:DUF423 domain-containing protein [Ferruginibacter lapsinanis]|uniref:DUF423 domain-containing protein n=1 Tax=Ferruginibacter lapsinanis TaxID=563172 RepID=UPI001E621F57|nr:DUF423 domain-containing protein [Ferruginibacter lapsinanis]UEG50191.1 DUF423 domain-containing protein [Ferruginibacter lapsinanis]